MRKFRGSGILRGRHPFHITSAGIQLYPRIEAAFARPSAQAVPGAPLATGVPALDELLGGGLPAGTATAVVGPAGIGKTTIAMHFLSQSSAAERGLHFGFFESPAQLLAKADRLGLDFAQKMAGGHLEVMWQPRGEHILDELAYRLLDTVRDRAVKRVVIDGLAAFLDCATDQERLGRLLVCLMNELAARGATTLLTLEGPESPGPRMLPWEFSGRVENILSMSFIGDGPDVKRSLQVAKMRDSGHERVARDFEITGRGLSLGGKPGTRDDGLPAAQEGRG